MSLILIIEDSKAMAEAAEKVLRAAGYDTAACLTPTEAVSICQERKPDLVVTEYFIQEGTGLDVLKKTAQLDPAPTVIVAAGCGNEEAAAKAMAMGAKAYLVKGDRYLKELPGRVRACLDEMKEAEALKSKNRLKRRLEAQNEMANWMAHNFKNILAASIGYLNLINLKDPGQNRQKQEEFLAESRSSQESAIHLLEQLIRMTDAEVGEAEKIIVAEVVDEAWEHAKSKVVAGVESHYPERLPEVKDKTDQTVFLNSARLIEPLHMVRADLTSIMEALLQNALEAVLNSADPRILVLGEKNGDKLELTVKDNGRGMSDNVFKHALEPFFSTKGEVGVGMSLSLVSSLVIRHGGDLNIKTSPGAGTTVKIIFPGIF